MRRRSTPSDLPRVPDELRCRRSNGKDWRCSEQALPDLSYCAYHHRLNYHRPPPSGSGSSRRKGDLGGGDGSGGEARGDVKRRRRRRRRKEDLICLQDCFHECGSLLQLKTVNYNVCVFFTDRDHRSTLRLVQQTPKYFEIRAATDPDRPTGKAESAFLFRKAADSDPFFTQVKVMGSPIFQSSKDAALLNINGDDSCLSDPIRDAVPVRCRPNGESTITDLLSSNGLVQEMNTDELSISDTVFGGLPVPDELRCKRSNGKEWRCTEQALPGLSYCPYHHHLNYNRPPSKARGTPRTSRTKTKQQLEPDKLLCRRTNGKGWKCPNAAVEGLSYCPYHHQLNYRTGTSSLASDDSPRMSRIKVKTQKLVPEEQLQQTHELLLDGLHYTF